jgi:class 3 adenylate cyclase
MDRDLHSTMKTLNLLASDKSYHDDFPVIGLLLPSINSVISHSWRTSNEEVSFAGQIQNCCVCFIDMMNSTKIVSELNSTQVSRYYGIFLNAMATIAKNFGAKIIKNAGDCLIFYFPKTSTSSDNQAAFKEVLECGITMIAARRAINGILLGERLPPLNYRISYDYGEVQFAKSTSSQSEDLFGSTVNICAKINSKAPANGMVIGDSLYHIVKAFDDYYFKQIEGYSIGIEHPYAAYIVNSKYDRNILNPFKRKSIAS